MDTHETEAIVLHTRDYGESDRLITFYTRSGGKLKGIAKGARRSKKRFVHAFELFSLAELKYRERKSLIWIEACKLLEPYLALRLDVERWGYSALICEVVLEMAPEGDPQEELFALLKGALARLSQDKDPLNVVLLFLLRFLDITGYLPGLEGCGVCRRSLRTSTRWWWRMSRGVLICPDHRSMEEDHLMLDLGTLVLIEQSRAFPVDRMWRLHLLQERKVPLFDALVEWIRAQIRKELKSLKLLEQVQSA